ncbi:MAG: lamin tail domain-containing protein, partial [Acidobacteria bacterium]|nr:lamin tail domain-containing protein [Acidobacteriota bacterium]
VFDPRVVYDPYNNRWITAIVSNAASANSSVEIGISDTSDPQGTYHLYRYIVGCAAGGISPITGAACNTGGEWADFPMLGFSKGWVGITWNQFTTSTSAFIAGRGIFIDYPNLRTGPVSPTAFTASGLDFCTHPATTLDANEVNLYFVAHLSSGGATYRKWTLGGNPPSLGGTVPTITVTATLTRPGGAWTQPGGDIVPQTCVGVAGVTCPTTLRRGDSGDAQVRSNVIYRNGNLYYPQTISLPAGTAASNDAARLAVQWTIVSAATGAFVDGGRVEDPTATKLNGGKHYVYGGIAVNKNGDILLGYTQAASNQFFSAGYSFRLGTDAAGTMRDPVIYKAGEDYYSKTFSGTRNRWGDYSHAVVDPSNDRDLWVVQEYAGTRTVPDANTTTNNSRWGTWWAKVNAPAGAGDLMISEFRLFGPNGPAGAPAPEPNEDEFIEIYNNNTSPLTVNTLDGSAGYAIAASDGVIRCTIPSGTVIPARGHYLCANSDGYSLGSYPAGNATTATPDATYTDNILNNAGIALFNTANTLNFSTATRLDAAGSTSEANTLYREGAGYPALTQFLIEYSYFRDICGKQGSISNFAPCSTFTPVDTNNNAADFVFVDTNGTPAGAGQRLGAPGPENLSSPVVRAERIKSLLLDATTASSSPPNRVRDFTSDPPNNSTFGTLDIRRRFYNNTGAAVTRLRFRVMDITTFPAPSGVADLRVRTSSALVVGGINDATTCPGGVTPCSVTVQGTTLEEPPTQPNGGAFNSSLAAGTVALGSPLAPGAVINLRFLLGIQATGSFRFFIVVEALP